MTQALTVRALERGVARVFRLDMEPSEIELLKHASGDTPPTGAAVAHLMGLDWVDETYIEMFPISDLDGLGLANYLIQGGGVAEADIAADRDRLNALTGEVLIVYSRAFQGEAAQLKPGHQLIPVGTYSEDRPQVSFEPLPSKSAKGIITGSATATRSPHMSLMLVLLALPTAALIIGVIIYGVLK